MARRAAYKGNLMTTNSLPVDSVTPIGIIVMLGTIVTAKGLSAEGLKQCTEIVENLCEHATFHGPLLLIPEHLSLSLQSTHGKVFKKDVATLFKNIEIDPTRQ